MLRHSLLLLGLQSRSLGPVAAALEFGLQHAARGQARRPCLRRDLCWRLDKKGLRGEAGTSKGLTQSLTYSRRRGQGANELTATYFASSQLGHSS